MKTSYQIYCLSDVLICEPLLWVPAFIVTVVAPVYKRKKKPKNEVHNSSSAGRGS